MFAYTFYTCNMPASTSAAPSNSVFLLWCFSDPAEWMPLETHPTLTQTLSSGAKEIGIIIRDRNHCLNTPPSVSHTDHLRYLFYRSLEDPDKIGHSGPQS